MPPSPPAQLGVSISCHTKLTHSASCAYLACAEWAGKEFCVKVQVLQSLLTNKRRNFLSLQDPMLGKMISKVLKTDRSTVGKVLSAVVEKIFSDKMSILEKADSFVESTGPVLAEVLSSSVIYDLLSAISEFPTEWLFLNSCFGSKLWWAVKAKQPLTHTSLKSLTRQKFRLGAGWSLQSNAFFR